MLHDFSHYNLFYIKIPLFSCFNETNMSDNEMQFLLYECFNKV